MDSLAPPVARTRTSEYVIRSDGIVVQTIVSRDRQMLADAEENARAFNALVAPSKRPLLVDMKVAYSTGPGVREYYASEEASRYVAALAMVTHSTTTTMIGNFFLRMNRPAYPCRMFNELEGAVTWLRSLPRS